MARRAKKNIAGGFDLDVDMSPMIDLVFLLLIFFMIASTMITYKKDPNVKIPTALDGKVPEVIENRVVMNVYQDGSVHNEDGKPITLEQVTEIMRKAKAKSRYASLHLRADKRVSHGEVNDVIKASAEGGVSDVIFSSYVTDK